MKKVARLRIINSEESTTERDIMASENIGVRTTGRIKKPKAVFDPSDNYLPRAQRPIGAVGNTPNTTNTSPHRKRDTISSGRDTILLSPSSVDSSSDSADLCEVCFKREAKRGAHAKNKFLACIACKKSVHKLCLSQEFDDFELLRRFYKCEDCRRCSICVDSQKNKNDLITCTKCVKTYHGSCHVPPFKSRNSNLIRSWKCCKCTIPTTPTVTAVSTTTTSAAASAAIERREKPVKAARETQQSNERAMSSSSTTLVAGTAVVQQQQQKKQQQLEHNEKPTHLIKTTTTTTTLVPLSRKGLANATSTSGQANGKVRSYNTVIDFEKSINKSVLDNGTTTLVLGSAAATAAPATSTAAAKSIKKNTVAYKEYNISEHIDLPDVKNWSVDQVANFMHNYFPKDAHIFREHEIDGESLLLMKRSDVVKKLAIKLGPALRIYSLILKLQTQTNDPTLGWNCDV